MIEWKYLKHPVFNVRQIVAASYIPATSSAVIELGCYETLTAPFLTRPHYTVGIDSRLKDTEWLSQAIRENFPVAIKLPAWTQDRYSVVILGMDLELDDAGREALYALIRYAETVVIEFPPQHKPSVEQFEGILKHTERKVRHKIIFDFSENDFDLEGSAPLMAVRHLYVL